MAHFSRFINRYDRFGSLLDDDVYTYARAPSEKLTFAYGSGYGQTRELQPLNNSRMLGWMRGTLDTGEPFWWNAEGDVSNEPR